MVTLSRLPERRREARQPADVVTVDEQVHEVAELAVVAEQVRPQLRALRQQGRDEAGDGLSLGGDLRSIAGEAAKRGGDSHDGHGASCSFTRGRWTDRAVEMAGPGQARPRR